jgi:hypothetical protein
LRTVSIRGRQYGVAMHSNGNGEVLIRQAAPLTADARRASTDLPDTGSRRCQNMA